MAEGPQPIGTQACDVWATCTGKFYMSILALWENRAADTLHKLISWLTLHTINLVLLNQKTGRPCQHKTVHGSSVKGVWIGGCIQIPEKLPLWKFWCKRNPNKQLSKIYSTFSIIIEIFKVQRFLRIITKLGVLLFCVFKIFPNLWFLLYKSIFMPCRFADLCHAQIARNKIYAEYFWIYYGMYSGENSWC